MEAALGAEMKERLAIVVAQGQIAQLDVFVTVQVDATANPAKVSRLRFDADDLPLLARDFSGQERKIAFVASNIYKGLA